MARGRAVLQCGSSPAEWVTERLHQRKYGFRLPPSWSLLKRPPPALPFSDLIAFNAATGSEVEPLSQSTVIAVFSGIHPASGVTVLCPVTHSTP